MVVPGGKVEHPPSAPLLRRRLDTPLTDAELVERAREGDVWAEEALFRRHLRALLAIAMRIVGDRADAEDIVQEACVSALQRLHTLREPAAFRAWLLRITVRRAQRILRTRRLLRMLGLAPTGDPGLMASLAASGADAETKAELALLDRCLSALSPALRIAWILRRVEGQRLVDVAQACDVSLATIKRRIGRADAHIRKHVNFEDEVAT